MLTTYEKVTEVTLAQNGICCRICRGLGICYLACLLAPPALLLVVLGAALLSLFG